MSDTSLGVQQSGTQNFNRQKLFWGSCISLLTTAFAFTVINSIAFPVKQEFILTNEQSGVFLGVFFIGFTVSQFVFAPLCDTIGIKWIFRGAFVGHVGGAIILLLAQNYWMAVAGSLFCGLGAGLVEAGGNPLVASLYPKEKAARLNRFHMWFPYGNLLAALITTLILSNLLSALGVGWRGNLFLVLIPAIVYGVMMLFANYPKTESASAGISFTGNLKAIFSPLMLLMLAMMLLTASMELPPSSWVPSVLQAGGVNGLLVFGFVFGIMGTLRLVAAPILKALTPTGVLLSGAVVGTLGLWLFSQASSTFEIFATAALWAIGIALFWPTMLGFVAERIPKSGALGLGMMGAVGMLASFFVTPWLGNIADNKGHSQIPTDKTLAVFESVKEDWPAIASGAGILEAEINNTINTVESVTDQFEEDGSLPVGETAQALRAIMTTDLGAGTTSSAKDEAAAILNPADNYGGKESFKTLAPVGLVLIAVFLFLFIQDRRGGGYQAEVLENYSEAHADEAAVNYP